MGVFDMYRNAVLFRALGAIQLRHIPSTDVLGFYTNDRQIHRFVNVRLNVVLCRFACQLVTVSLPDTVLIDEFCV